MESRGHTFVVEQAGCESCATRVRDALTPLTTVRAVEVDADEDVATVSLGPDAELSEEAVNRALTEASRGSGHSYRVKPGSWRSTL
jgi:copper chaperone CopZ